MTVKNYFYYDSIFANVWYYIVKLGVLVTSLLQKFIYKIKKIRSTVIKSYISNHVKNIYYVLTDKVYVFAVLDFWGFLQGNE